MMKQFQSCEHEERIFEDTYRSEFTPCVYGRNNMLTCTLNGDVHENSVPFFTMTIKDFCKKTGLGKTFAYSLIRDGKIDVVKIQGRTLVLVASVEALIERSLVKRVS